MFPVNKTLKNIVQATRNNLLCVAGLSYRIVAEPAGHVLVVGQAHGETAAHLKFVDDQRIAVDRWILDVDLRWPDR